MGGIWGCDPWGNQSTPDAEGDPKICMGCMGCMVCMVCMVCMGCMGGIDCMGCMGCMGATRCPILNCS